MIRHDFALRATMSDRGPMPSRLADRSYVVIDTETTGVDPAIDRIVEVAAVRFLGGKPQDRFTALCDPGREVPATASAVHHLTLKHLRDAPTFELIANDLNDFVGDNPIVAHNAPFDRAFLPGLGDRPWFCSLRFARHLWPDAPAHRNEVLRYWLGLDHEELDGLVPHRALTDALVTGFLFNAELDVFGGLNPAASYAHVADYIDSPVRVERLPFGRHRGRKISEIPTDYLRWLSAEASKASTTRGGSIDRDTLAAVRLELESR